MNLSTARTLLRGRLQEAVEDYFTDVALNRFLNIAYQNLFKMVLAKGDRQALVYVVTADIVADQEFYSWPAGMLYELAVQMKPSGATRYRQCVRGTIMQQAQDRNAETEVYPYPASDQVMPEYVHVGTSYTFSPIPTVSATAGIRIQYVPSPSVVDDSDVFDVKIPLHMAIVIGAEIQALGETGEDDTKAKADLLPYLTDIPLFYLKSGGDNDSIQPSGVNAGY